MNSERLVAIVRQPWMVVLIWLGALLKLGRVFASAPPVAKQVDFVNYYDSALALRHGIILILQISHQSAINWASRPVGMIYASGNSDIFALFRAANPLFAWRLPTESGPL